MFTFTIDEKTDELIEELMKEFGVKTKAAAIRKALALSRVAVRTADPSDNSITLKIGDKEQKILLQG